MQIIRNRPESGAVRPTADGGAVAIGNFDGVHRGHAALLARCREHAGPRGTVSLITFEPLPQTFFRPAQAPARLTTVYQKLGHLRRLGVDRTWMMRFDARLAALSARDFADFALRRGLGARHVVVGKDFRFGNRREGDVAMLAELGASMGFGVETLPAVEEDGQRISSSGIRELLAASDFGAAARWLGRPFRMEGHVLPGAGLGRKLGYPTANLRIRARPSPVEGVLAAFARVVGQAWRPAVINLGRRPAVGGGEPLLEVHFFDLDADLYGQRLEVQFVAKLRDEAHFDSMDALVAQMHQDAEAARSLLASAEAPVPDA